MKHGENGPWRTDEENYRFFTSVPKNESGWILELGGVAEGQELPIEVQHRMIERSDKEEDDVSMHIEPSHQLESHPTDAVFSGEGKKFKKSKLKGIDRDGNIISE